MFFHSVTVPTISATIATTSAPKRNSWLRYSMRKLYPIKIPEPDAENACARYQPLTIQPTTSIDNTNAHNDTTIRQLKTINTNNNTNTNTLQSSSHQQHGNENIINNDHDRQQSHNRQSLVILPPIVGLIQDQDDATEITTTTRNAARNSVRGSQTQNRTSQQQYFQSEASSLRSSRNPSPVSSTSSAASSSVASITEMTLESNTVVQDASTINR